MPGLLHSSPSKKHFSTPLAFLQLPTFSFSFAFSLSLVALTLVALLLPIQASAQYEEFDETIRLRQATVNDAIETLESLEERVTDQEGLVNEAQSVVESVQARVLEKEQEVAVIEEELAEKREELTQVRLELRQREQDVVDQQLLVDERQKDVLAQQEQVQSLQLAVQQVQEEKQRAIEASRQAEIAARREEEKQRLLVQLQQLTRELNRLGVSVNAGASGVLNEQIDQGNQQLAQALPACQTNLPFKDTGDGYVTDSDTSLVWQKCSLGQTYDTTQRRCLLRPGASNKRLITSRLREYNREQLFLQRYSRDSGGGTYYSDWRLPSLTELQTIMKQPCAGDEFLYYRNYFPDMQPERYLTNSVNSNGEVVFVHFGNGEIIADKAEATGYVRLVR